MAEKKKMSVAEILAAARQADRKGGEPPPSQAAPAEPAAETGEPAAEAPAPKPKPAGKPAAKPAAAGERPSVKDILAMARGGAGAAAAPKPAAKAEPKPKPAAEAKPKEAAAKPAAKAAPAKPAVAKDTASILAAARSAAKKPGPMSKAEAASLPAAKAPAREPKTAVAVPPMPERPAFSAAKPPAISPPDEGRRGILAACGAALFGSALRVGMTAMSATFGLWTLGGARFMFPNVLTEPPSRFKVGFPGLFSPGQVETKFVAQFGVWIVNTEYNGQQQIFALRTVCTHLGCTPNWLEGEQKFKCPCHGSGFYKDGINFEGPAPRPLERYAIGLGDDGQLEVDKSKLFQQELGQWEDAASRYLV